MAISPLAKRIKETREVRGFSQSDLARLTKVTPTAVWNWEITGTKPRPDTLDAIAIALAVTPEFLLTGDAGSLKAETRKVSDIIAQAETEIAQATGAALERVKLRLDIAPA